jgi:cystathionine beta-lyase
MGSVVTRDEALHQLVQFCHMRVGYGVSGNDAELVLRGLNSMALRYAAQDRTTRALAVWLQQQPQIEAVLHPALPGSPGHEAWQRDCSAAACLMSAVFKPGYSQATLDAFCDGLKLFNIGYSWAGPISLCVPYDVPAIRTTGWPYKGGLVRFSIGLEAVSDLQADLEQALASMQYS